MFQTQITTIRMITNSQGNILANGDVTNSSNKNRYNNSTAGVNVNVRRVKLISGSVGFVLGILTSFLASWLYDLLKPFFN